jgi:hypothetical protein
MNTIVQVAGTDVIYARMRAEGRKIGAILEPTFIIGYSAPYAIYVHEDLEARHITGQAKFIEKVVREKGGELYMQIAAGVINRELWIDVLTRAAEWLLAESKKLVPVDTGALKDSGFYNLE